MQTFNTKTHYKYFCRGRRLLRHKMIDAEMSTVRELHSENYLNTEVELSPPLFGIVGLSVISACGMVGNILIIFLFVKSQALRNPTNLFIINLAMADMGFLLCVGPLVNNMLVHGGKQGYGTIGCYLHGLMIATTATVSLITMGVIAFSRYLAIVHPTKKSMLSWRVCSVMCIGCWAYPSLTMIPLLFDWARVGWVPRSYTCGYDWSYNTAYNIFLFLFIFGLISVLMFFFYYNIFVVFRASKRRIAGEGRRGKGMSKDERRLALQLLVIFIIYNICWSPFFSMALFIDPNGQGPEWLYGIFLMLLFFNCSVNVLVYLHYNRVFRMEFLLLFGVKPTTELSTTAPSSSGRSNN